MMVQNGISVPKPLFLYTRSCYAVMLKQSLKMALCFYNAVLFLLTSESGGFLFCFLQQAMFKYIHIALYSLCFKCFVICHVCFHILMVSFQFGFQCLAQGHCDM